MNKRTIKPDIEKYADEVYMEFYKHLTDQLFMFIEGDNSLLQQYNDLSSKYTKEILNQDLGLLFKELFNVDNLKRNYNPESDLINSYTQHTTPKK